MNPQGTWKGGIWHDSRSLRCIACVPDSGHSWGAVRWYSSNDSGVTVIVAEHCGVAGAMLSTLPSLAHIIFITTSEVGDIVVTVL